MTMVATRAGRAVIAKALKAESPGVSDGLTVKLFKVNYTPTTISEEADFTEAEFTGYAPATTTYGDTSGPTLATDDQVMRISGAPLVWDCTAAPETIYGWYLVDDLSGDVLFAEKYDTPHVLEVGSRHTLFLDIAIGACG